MDWKKRLKGDEKILKALIDRLDGATDGGTMDGRELARRHLGEKLAEMTAYVEDCLSGRSDSEKSVLRYKLRIEYPLFAHLLSLSAMPREYVEFSCTA
jgi:hypothetical protein